MTDVTFLMQTVSNQITLVENNPQDETGFFGKTRNQQFVKIAEKHKIVMINASDLLSPGDKVNVVYSKYKDTFMLELMKQHFGSDVDASWTVHWAIGYHIKRV